MGQSRLSAAALPGDKSIPQPTFLSTLTLFAKRRGGVPAPGGGGEKNEDLRILLRSKFLVSTQVEEEAA